MDGAIITTYRCNARCHMCHTWQHPSRVEEEIALDTIAKLPDNLDHLNITGGEPLLRKDIEEIINIVYDKARCIEVSTNGYFTNKIVRIAQRFPKLKIRVSIEGLPSLNDKLRGPRDGFDHALRTILELKRSGIRDIGFSMVVCDKNAPDLLNLYSLSAFMGVEFTTAPMHNSFYFHKKDNRVEDIDLVIDQLQKLIVSMLMSPRNSLRMKIKDWLRAYFNYGMISYIKDEVPVLGGCPAGREMFFLSPYGDILPCNGSPEEWKMGNLNCQSFEEIWKSAEARDVRKLVDSCKIGCWMMGTTRGKMRRNPAKILWWILARKLCLAVGS